MLLLTLFPMSVNKGRIKGLYLPKVESPKSRGGRTLAVIELKHIGKSYDNGHTFVIEDMNLSIDENDFVVILGPSGCGKSTSLRMIAGIESISRGELWMDGKMVNSVPSKDRDIAMVFQNYALFPHMTVEDNIGFALKINKVKKQEIKDRVNNAAKILGLEHLLSRKPGALSGGQQQRVALGRAMVNDSKFFLMDEPLSNLDANLRTQMREEILSLHQRLGTTTIFVTHDQIEAMTMATKIVVLNLGKVMQVGTPNEIYDHPANVFVANFIGNPKMNFFDGTIQEHILTINQGLSLAKVQPVAQHNNVKIGIRPEHVLICPPEEALVSGTLSFSEMLGSDLNLFVDTPIGKLVCKTDRTQAFHVGDHVHFRFDTPNIHIFDTASEKVMMVEMSDIHE